ncbi:kelch-like protein 23 [Branchiostoma lanceolatum]|uniref:kelch-like protein 23 n=1 Tax=Branchiostoma lanceolatum TaxID=7740 RepID=UPI0034537A0A
MTEYDFRCPSHIRSLFQTLRDQQLSGEFTDVVLRVEHCTFPCHRAVLAACSPYFSTMFSGSLRESRQKEIRIHELEPRTMALLLDYIYTSEAKITIDNCQGLLSAAELFQFPDLKHACAAFLQRHIDMSNSLGIQHFALAHQCLALKEEAHKYTLDHFPDVAKSDEFLDISLDVLRTYICNPATNVKGKEQILEAVMRWVQWDDDKRKQHLTDLLKVTQLNKIAPDYLDRLPDEYYLIRESKESLEVITRAKEQQAAGGKLVEDYVTPNFPGYDRGSTDVMLIVGGLWGKHEQECRGVFMYETATDYWRQCKQLPKYDMKYYAVAAAGHRVFVTGGYDSYRKRPLSLVQVYDLMDDNWIGAPELNRARYRHCSVSLGDYVYVLGGFDGHIKTASVERLNVSRFTEWERFDSMLQEVEMASATAYGEKIYVFGGATPGEHSSTAKVQCYSLDRRDWEYVSPLPTSTWAVCSAAARGLIAVLGVTFTSTRLMQLYNPDADQWIDVPPLPYDRMYCSVAALDGKIYVTGGEDTNTQDTLSTMHVYDPSKNTWVEMYLPAAVNSHVSATVQNVNVQWLIHRPRS